MSRACSDAGLPEPEFTEIATRFRVTLRTESTHEAVTDETSQRILAFLHEHNGRSTAEIAQHIGLTSRTAQTRLARLAELGLAVAVGSSPRDPRRKWYAGSAMPAFSPA